MLTISRAGLHEFLKQLPFNVANKIKDFRALKFFYFIDLYFSNNIYPIEFNADKLQMSYKKVSLS